MGQIASTHLNAYVTELQEAEQEQMRLKGRISTLKRQIDEKRAEEGLEPLYEVQGEKQGKRKKAKEQVPPEASGFGGPRNNDGSPKVDSEGNA
jgi:hypothetical protein